MAYFKCGNKGCNFIFQRSEMPDACPDCGKGHIIEAKKEEIEALRKFRDEDRGEPK